MKFRVPPPKVAEPKKSKQTPIPGVDAGDHVYVRHETRGPITVRVLAHGQDGLTGVCDQKQRHRVTWDRVLGHKSRMLQRYRMVEQGADGALIEDDKGQRRYIAGEVPIQAEAVRPPAARKDDPLIGGQDRLHKAPVETDAQPIRKSLIVPPGAVVLFAKAQVANRPGLALQDRTDRTDRTGKHTKRWVRTMKDQPKEREKAKPDEKKPDHGAPMQHGDTVAFRHGDVGGHGKITASGRDGVTLQTEDGKEQQVRHEHLVKPEDKGPAEDAADGAKPGGGDGGGGGEIPPDQFNANDYAQQHNDPSVTADDILKAFPPEVATKIADTNTKLATLPQTIDTFKKDGQWTPERKAKHAEIIAKFLSDERVLAAKPAPGTPPSFIILGGRGGSGKSWFKNKVYTPGKAIVLDADEIKHELPEYKGWNAAQVHEESGELFDAITHQAQAMGLNIVHDATMKTSKKAVTLVQGFKDAGYRTEAHYMYLPPQVAAKRAVDRFLGETQRFVPPGIVLGNTTNEGSFDQVKGLVDAWSFRDNNRSKEEGPKLLSESANEADPGKSGLRGLPAAESEHGDRDIPPDPEADRRPKGGAGSISKALAAIAGRRGVIFLKATVAGAGTADLFTGDVAVSGHVRGGKYVAPYHQTRTPKPAKPPMADAHADGIAGEVFAHHAAWRLAYGKSPPSKSYAAMIGAWANDGKRKVSDDDEGAILRGMQRSAERAMVTPAASPAAAVPAASKSPIYDSLSDASKAAVRKMKDLIRHGTGLRELYFHPATVTALEKDGVWTRSGRDTLTLTDKGRALANVPSVRASDAADDMPAKDKATLASAGLMPSPDVSHFYVSAIDGKKRHLVAGPYGSHDEARAQVEAVRNHADSDPRAHFMAWGTAGATRAIKTPLGENWTKPAAAASP
jgi:predicted kinase